MHGDWASRDAGGFWFLHGRSDDTLNVSGRRIGPSEVEEVLLRDSRVRAAAAIPVPHPVKGEVIWCLVVPAGQGDGLEAALADQLAAYLGKPFRPERVMLVPDLPQTRSAKIARRAIRAAVLRQPPGDLSGIANPESLDAIQACVSVSTS
jgi:acetyl-CoA synthetase